jgi:hypothetical protein
MPLQELRQETKNCKCLRSSTSLVSIPVFLLLLGGGSLLFRPKGFDPFGISIPNDPCPETQPPDLKRHAPDRPIAIRKEERAVEK